MTTLDAIRVLLWDDLPAPREEEPPKIDLQKALFDTEPDFNVDEEQARETTRVNQTFNEGDEQ